MRGWPSRWDRTTLRTPTFLVAVTVGFGAIAVLIALLLGAPLGPDHSCPGGSPATACHYPADTAGWLVEWAGGGIASGLLLGTVVAVVLGRDRPHGGPQRHLLRQDGDS